MSSDLSSEYGDILALIEREETSQGKLVTKPVIDIPKAQPQPENKETLILLNKYKGLLNSSLSNTTSNPSTKESETSFNVSNKSSIVETLESKLRQKTIKEFEDYRRYPRPYISTSEILDCPRKCFYTRKLYTVNWSEQYVFPYLSFHGGIGQTIHKQLQDILELQNCEDSLIDNDFSLKGKLDGRLGSNLYEIKTVDPEKYNKYEYLQSHYDQANVYCYLWNKLKKNCEKMDNIVIVYACKDFKRVRTVDLKPNFESAKDMIMKAPYIKDCLDNNILPTANVDKESCNFCYFKKQCKNDGMESKDLNPKLETKPSDVVILF